MWKIDSRNRNTFLLSSPFTRVRTWAARRLRRRSAGRVDILSNHRAQGWALGPPDGVADVEARLGEVVLARTAADLYRPDLQAAGHGHGRSGFDLAFSRTLSDAELAGVRIVRSATGVALPVAPDALRPLGLIRAGEPAEARVPYVPRFRSRFGGLWTDLSHAPALLEGKRALGLITASEHEQLTTWIHGGYVILRGVIPADLCDRVRADAERAAGGEIDLMREIAGPRGLTVVPAAGRRDGKLIDLYAKSAAALETITHTAIVRFLNLVFERPAIVFQSLYFEFGSEQPLHQDTAFVRVSSPLQIAASWTALEDIEAGTGELEYVPGSHEIPEFLFDGAFRAMPPGSPEEDKFYAHLRQSVAARSLGARRFLARKGDVLIWSADLVHGGSPVAASPERPTRRSLVAHYCPADCRPAYFRNDGTITWLTPAVGVTQARHH